MTSGHKILKANIMHKRVFPKENFFSYGVYYYSIDLSNIETMSVPYNRFGLTSFYDKDHGNKDGKNLKDWASNLLGKYDLDKDIDKIVLVCMPRVLGYVFNPVSFWLCFDKEGELRAVICEVNNTFGERHSYICAHEDKRSIKKTDWIIAEKLFHVSPFLEVNGHYRFCFDIEGKNYKIFIDHYDGNNNKKLMTTLSGELYPLTKGNRILFFFRYPLVTMKAIFLIHYQALKIILKSISYIKKPKQKDFLESSSEGLRKNDY